MQAYPELAEKHKELLKVYAENQKTFKYELALWICDNNIVFEDFAPKALPTMPQLVREYYQMDPGQRARLSESFWKDKEVEKYFHDRDAIKNLNTRNRKTLEECLAIIPVSDLKRREKLTDYIFEYKERGF